jgi:succinyl-CoA synthetase beta subunit
MVPPGTDLRVHVRDDDRIGPIITVGLGGVQADLIADEVSRLAPVSPMIGRRMVERTRASAALDDDALTRAGEIVARLAHLASDHSRLDELDINPLIVHGGECWVADATLVLGDPERPEPVRRLDT